MIKVLTGMYYVKSTGEHIRRSTMLKVLTGNMKVLHALCLEYSQAISTMLKVNKGDMKNLQALY